MSSLILIIPFVLSLFLLIFFNKKVIWWEYLVIIIPGIVINLIISEGMKYYNCKDIEYLGDYVKEVRYYESWNEWVVKRCTRTYTDSKGNIREQSYDCSYCKSHPERWEMVTLLKHKYLISKQEYEYLVKLWNAPSQFVDLHRSYYTKDGDMYFSKWDNRYETIIPITIENEYRNKVKGSKSVFKFESITESDAKELGLFEYPALTKQKIPFLENVYINTYQNAVIGYDDDNEFISKMDYINAKYGPLRFIRTYLLIFKDKPHDIAFKQQSYWEGGNFNEHIICLGLNTSTNKFEWCETFSWEDKPDLAVKTKQWFIDNNDIDSLKEFPTWYEDMLNNNSTWVCKNRDDFEYLKTELSNGQFFWLLIISIIICVGMSIWVVVNNITYNK